MSARLKLSGLQLHPAVKANAFIKFVIISQRVYVAGPSANIFTGLSMLPEDTLLHDQPVKTDRDLVVG